MTTPPPVKAWILVSPDGRLLPDGCSSSRGFLMHRKTEHQRIVRVEIRPRARARKKA